MAGFEGARVGGGVTACADQSESEHSSSPMRVSLGWVNRRVGVGGVGHCVQLFGCFNSLYGSARIRQVGVSDFLKLFFWQDFSLTPVLRFAGAGVEKKTADGWGLVQLQGWRPLLPGLHC